jgi:hypothetical protein
VCDFGKGFESDDWDGRTGVFINGDKELLASADGDLLEISVDGERFPYYYRLCEKGFRDE